MEQLKKELEGCYDFSVRKAFKAIDEPRYNYLTEGSIRMFLRKMGHQVLKAEIVAIIRRFDLDGDSRISFQEFNEAIRPISPDMVQAREPLIIIPAKRRSPSKDNNSPLRQSIVKEQRRPKSADKTAKRTKKKRSLFEMNRIPERGSPLRNPYDQDALNKSVTFNNQVQVHQFS